MSHIQKYILNLFNTETPLMVPSTMDHLSPYSQVDPTLLKNNTKYFNPQQLCLNYTTILKLCRPLKIYNQNVYRNSTKEHTLTN